MIVTVHAVEQFVERCATHLDFNEARALLVERSLRASKMRTRTVKGQDQWRITDPDAVLVTKHDPSCGLVCVTVLWAADAAQDDPSPDDVLAALAEMDADRRDAAAASGPPSWWRFDRPDGLATEYDRRDYRRAVEEEMQRLRVMAQTGIAAMASGRHGPDPARAVADMEAMLDRVRAAHKPTAEVVHTWRASIQKLQRRVNSIVARARRADLKHGHGASESA
jgi:hypothetical protein